jgi:PIN domain nuclease of toxin-antitoxin system
VFHAQNGENLDKNVVSILDDYENLIYVRSEVVKEAMHLIRYKKINVKQWKTPNDVWKSIDEWGFAIDIAQAITNKMSLISSDQQFRHYKKQGLSLVFNNTHGK